LPPDQDLVEDESAEAVNSDLGCMRAESLYNNLPHHVKYCFMYLSIFQEDSNIKPRRLVQRWIAEGYLKGVRGSEVEEAGERVFSDFRNMTIIQPNKNNAAVTNSARITRCSVNPLMLGFITSKATEEKLVCMLDDCHIMAASEDTIRHVVVRRTWRRDQEHQYKSMDLSRIRSLTVFGEWRSFFLCHKMRMLRVLDLEGVEGLTGEELEHIGVFQHLRYLDLRSTQVEHLPMSLGNLRCLEMLDIRNTNVRRLPSVIANLMRLHVLLGGYSDHAHVSGGDLWGLEIPKVIGELRALDRLGTISVERQGREVIQKLRNLTLLRKLSVTGITDGNGPDLCSTLEHLGNLQSLTTRSDEPNGLSQSLQASSMLSSSLQHLQVLKLYGRLLTLPKWILGLRYLFKLYLHNTRLQGPELSDTIDGLARMPSLTTLLLLENSVMCLELVLNRHVFLELELLELSNLGPLSFLSFRAGAMPKLKMLQVDGCNNLKKISVVAGAMPKLETLQIKNCNNLEKISYEGAGIEMPMLKNFQVESCNNLKLLPFVAGDMPYLDALLIRHCSKLEVVIVPQAVPKLKVLQIDGCRKLHWLRLGVPAAVGLGVSFQMGDMPDLKELQVSGCHGLGRMSFGCGAVTKLETLRIEDCVNLLDLSFEAGATPKLEKFQIDGCSELMELSGLQHLNLKG
jgi:Leucine-rich repeat (LRR) protein